MFLFSFPLKSQRKVIKTCASKVNWNRNIVVIQEGAYLAVNYSGRTTYSCLYIIQHHPSAKW